MLGNVFEENIYSNPLHILKGNLNDTYYCSWRFAYKLKVSLSVQPIESGSVKHSVSENKYKWELNKVNPN